MWGSIASRLRAARIRRPLATRLGRIMMRLFSVTLLLHLRYLNVTGFETVLPASRLCANPAQPFVIQRVNYNSRKSLLCSIAQNYAVLVSESVRNIILQAYVHLGVGIAGQRFLRLAFFT